MSRLAMQLGARADAMYSAAMFSLEGRLDTVTGMSKRTRVVQSDGQRAGVRRSARVAFDDRSHFRDYTNIERAKMAVRKVAAGWDVLADAGIGFSVEQKVQTDFQTGQSLLELCGYDDKVLESIAPWVVRTYGWRFWGRMSQVIGPRRVGKTFGTCAVKTIVASVCGEFKAAFVNLYSESGGQIIQYIKDFHRILENDPRHRIDTIFIGVHNKYHLRIQSHFQRMRLRDEGIELPDPKRLRATLNTSNNVFNQISSLPNRSQQAGAVRVTVIRSSFGEFFRSRASRGMAPTSQALGLDECAFLTDKDRAVLASRLWHLLPRCSCWFFPTILLLLFLVAWSPGGGLARILQARTQLRLTKRGVRLLESKRALLDRVYGEAAPGELCK